MLSTPPHLAYGGQNKPRRRWSESGHYLVRAHDAGEIAAQRGDVRTVKHLRRQGLTLRVALVKADTGILHNLHAVAQVAAHAGGGGRAHIRADAGDGDVFHAAPIQPRLQRRSDEGAVDLLGAQQFTVAGLEAGFEGIAGLAGAQCGSGLGRIVPDDDHWSTVGAPVGQQALGLLLCARVVATAPTRVIETLLVVHQYKSMERGWGHGGSVPLLVSEGVIARNSMYGSGFCVVAK